MPNANVFTVLAIVLLATNTLILMALMRYLSLPKADLELKVDNVSFLATCFFILYLALLAAVAIGLAFPAK